MHNCNARSNTIGTEAKAVFFLFFPHRGQFLNVALLSRTIMKEGEIISKTFSVDRISQSEQFADQRFLTEEFGSIFNVTMEKFIQVSVCRLPCN